MPLRPIKGHPGRFLDTASGQVLNIAEYREDDKYDTIFLPGADPNTPSVPGPVIAFGSQFIFFRDITAKRPIDCNFTQTSRLSAGEEMVVDRIGIYPRTSISGMGEALDVSLILPYEIPSVRSNDIMRVAENAFFRVEVNNILLTEGPAYKYPSGYGISGFSLDTPNFNIGVPSTAAAAKLVKTQSLTSRHEVIGYFIFHNHDWITQEPDGPESVQPITLFMPMLVTAFLHGLIKSAVNK